MKKSRFTEEQIIGILNVHERGLGVQDIIRQYGISEQTFYRWKSKYGGMEVNEAKRLKTLEEENRKLKQIVGELTLDNKALRWILEKKP
jgi:putative transposase